MTRVDTAFAGAACNVPKNVGVYAPRVTNITRGAIGAQVVDTLGSSYQDISRIWIGTGDGMIAGTVVALQR